ncbi:hypothetical protein J1N35_037687 [Gossypium stocksii]|uniref:Uncharacterized protein n=1 Tax=Gossypium stocksii TaxID=47602 RepID=A0A9D3UKK0_9ROSI|nr:hypothetical protein J1N35_037687 [Gossypium stocksii]
MAKEANAKLIELSLWPITRACAKKFQEAISCYIDQVWGEKVTSLIDQSWTSMLCILCSLLKVEF